MRWCCLCLLTLGLAAADPFISDADWERGAAAAGAREAAGSQSLGSAALGLGLGILVIAGLGVGVVLVFRHLGRRQGQGRAARHLQHLESLSLGLKQHLHLVRLGDQVLVVGSHDRGLTAITTVPAADLDRARAAVLETGSVEPVETAPPPPGPPFAQAFAAAVQSVLGKDRR